MRKPLLLLFLICLFLKSYTQVIPDTMRVDWSGAGYGACFPDPTMVLNILDFGGSGNNLTNNIPAINAAIDSLHGQPGVLYFPPGTYLLSSTVSIPSGVILRGAGADSTVLSMKHTAYGFIFNGTASGSFVNIQGGYQKGSFRLVLAPGHGFAQGDYGELLETNGSWDSNPASWATNVVGQVVRINEVIGDTLILDKALRITYESSLLPRIRKIIPVTNAGIENMKISRDDTSRTASSYNICFLMAANCWVRGVEGNISLGSHCMIDISTNIEVTGCYFHNANNYDGGGTRGYGVTLNTHAGQCLIENNIFRHLRHAMMTKCGANGNVFAYNYSVDPFRNGAGETPSNGCGDISLHGHYSYANLFEGNVIQTVWIDQTWGPSGPFNTFFRNRAELYGMVTTSLPSEKQNFVGNEITNPNGMYGQYIVSTPGTFEYGNIVRGAITPAGTDILNDLSYFYTSRPALWDLPDWLLIGPPSLPGTTKIPAQKRDSALMYTTMEQPVSRFTFVIGPDSIRFRNYSVNANSWLWDFGDGSSSTEINPTHFYSDTGHYQVCLTVSDGCSSDSSCLTFTLYSTGINETDRNVVVYPVPAREKVSIMLPASIQGEQNIRLYDLTGKCVLRFCEKVSNHVVSLNIKNIPNGVYFCRLSGAGTEMYAKVVKISN